MVRMAVAAAPWCAPVGSCPLVGRAFQRQDGQVVLGGCGAQRLIGERYGACRRVSGVVRGFGWLVQIFALQEIRHSIAIYGI